MHLLGGNAQIVRTSEDIEQLERMLAEAKRPVIMAGDAVSQTHALAELVALAEALGAPVYAELIANTASFPSSHPLFRGAMARSQTAMRKIFDQHDVLFSVGADLFALSLPADVAPIGPDLRMIHLDTDPWELGKNYPAEVAILGNPKGTLPELTDATRTAMSGGAQKAAQDRLKSASEATKSELEKLRARARSLANETPIQPLALINAIGEILPKDAVARASLYAALSTTRVGTQKSFPRRTEFAAEWAARGR